MLENEPEIDYHIYKTYEILGMLGKGTYGQVYKVKNKKTQQIFAIKKICDAYQNLTDAKRTYRQLNYLFQLSHPCIVKLYQIVPGHRKNILINRQSNTSRTDFIKGMYDQQIAGYNTQKTHDGVNQNNTKANKHVYAVFQFVETDLSKALRRCIMQPIQRKYIAYQILQGIAYLHKSKLIHRDIKPSNILIDANCDIKICDFGLCRLKQQKNEIQQSEQNIITQYVASRWYRPPQILLGFSPCNQAIDMWGVGCVFAQLILRTPIFRGQSTMDQLQKIFRIIGLPSQNQIIKLQTEHSKFLLRTFTFSRKNKPQKLSQVLNQSSDQQLDLIEKLLKFNPQDRFSAEDALRHKYFQQIKEMNYNYEMYSFPVKIIDHTQPSSFLGDLKNFTTLTQQRVQNNPPQKGFNKKKQITLQQYQYLIQDLQRGTSRSSNRFYQGKMLNNQDKMIRKNESGESDGCLKQKSTRQSNFLVQHKRLQKQKQKYEIKQTDKILQNYQKQKSCSSSQKNFSLVDGVKQNRNAYSTMDNYYSNFSYQGNFQSSNELFINSNNDNLHFNKNCNKSMQDNLQENYGSFFNPFENQINIKGAKKSINKKTIDDNLKYNDLQVKKNEHHNRKKIPKKISTNKSTSKLSIDVKKDKSFIKNSSKHSQNLQNFPSQNLAQNKNKYNSYASLTNPLQTSYLTQLRGKVSGTKKLNDQKSVKLLKDESKNKFSSQQNNKKYNKMNLIKSPMNGKDNSIQRVQKQRKKSKDFRSFKNQQSRDGFRKTPEKSVSDKNMENSLNYFAKIQIKDSQNMQIHHAKSNNQLRKKTLQKKNQKSFTGKSVGKKKSQTKILASK